MTGYRISALCLALALPALASSAPVAKPQPATLRMPDMPLHDPWIVADRATRTYHLYTRNEPAMSGDPRIGIMAYTSRNLRDWSRPRIVAVMPTTGWANDGAWAPEVHRWRGRWYLFATYHNESAALKMQGVRKLHRRGTTLAVADRLVGPFVPVRNAEPVVDRETMTLDGTLYIDPAKRPWMVYAHEWVQTGDGTIEAVPLDDRLAASGPPRLLFHASAAPWSDGKPQAEGDVIRVTDGPELFRTRTGRLLMLWSSYDRTGYVQGLARSRSGTLAGPWEQLDPLVRRDSGHGMLFRRFDGTLMMVLHRPFQNARGKLYAMRDTGDRVGIVREETDLDGETDPTHP